MPVAQHSQHSASGMAKYWLPSDGDPRLPLGRTTSILESLCGPVKLSQRRRAAQGRNHSMPCCSNHRPPKDLHRDSFASRNSLGLEQRKFLNQRQICCTRTRPVEQFPNRSALHADRISTPLVHHSKGCPDGHLHLSSSDAAEPLVQEKHCR